MKVVSYSDLYSSIIRFCTLLGGEISQRSGKSIEFVYFDAIGDEGTLPDGDLLGFSDLTVLNKSEGIGFQVEVMLVMSVTEDTNLMRLETVMADTVCSFTKEEAVIVVYHMNPDQTLTPTANLVFTGDRLISPPSRDGSRTFKAFRCNLLCDKGLA